MAITADMITNVSRFYVALFGRAPDGAPLAAPSQDGLSYWTQSLSNGTSLATVANQMFATTEARAYYPGYYTNEQIANSFYINVLGRTPDAAGLAYWTAALNTAPNVGTVLYQMVVATAAYVPGSNPDPAIDAAAIVAQNLFHNRVVVAEYYGTHAGNIAGATIALNGVTDNSASIATAEAAIDAYIAAVPGLTLTLTTDANTGTAFTGGTGADTFVAVIGATSTLTAGDVLNGGSGTDTLTISATGAPAADTAAVVLTSIENISIANFETTPKAIDLSQATGLAKISVTSSSATGDSTFTGLGNLVIAEMSSGTGDLTLTYTDAAVVGTTDVQTLNLTAQTAGAFTVAGATTGGVETLNISSLSAANTIAVNDAVTATITTINVTGNQNLTLTEGTTNADDAVTTINAGTFTGKLAVTTGSVAHDMSITGGTANDTITFSGANFTAADTVDGGSGTDTLSIANTAAMTAATFGGVTNVEKVTLVGAAAALTLAANISATTINIANTGNQVVTLNTGYTNATTVTLENGDKVANTSANVALTVNMSGADLVTATSIGGGTGTDTINLTADSTAAIATNFANITKIDSIVIVDNGDAASGTAILGKDVDLNLGAYATALTIDGSALDGSEVDDETLTVDGSTATVNLIITGGGGADSITGGTANDSINAGAGNDTVTMGANLTLNDTLDGGSGTDTLSVSALTSTGLTNVTNFETLALSGAASTATLAANLSFTTISLTVDTNVAQVLTLSTGYTNATAVSVDAGDRVVNSANVAMTVSAKATNLEAADMTTIIGGTGTDTLNITADGLTNSTGIVAFDSLITNVDTITIVDKGNGASTAGFDVDLNLGSYAKALTIDASAMDAADATLAGEFATAEVLRVIGTGVSKALTITVGAGGSTISTGTGAYNDVVTGGVGVDAITSGAGNDNYSLGDGNDTVDMTSYLDNNDTIAGGAGTDTLSVNAGTIDVNYMNVTSMNKLALLTTGTTTLSTFANAAGITTITGLASAANTITATGMTANLTINAATTLGIIDSLTGGSGNDNFVFAGASSTVLPSLTTDAVIGGSGTDTLTIKMDAAASALTAVTLTNVATIEAITVTGTGAGGNVSLTSANGNFVSVTGAAISASGMTGTGTFVFDGSLEADSTFVITGATAANTLTGGTGADTITGGAAADKIGGGLGADVMAGGTGADTFVYVGAGFETGSVSPAVVYYGGTVTAGTSVSTAGLDKITDFAALDTIQTAAGAAANLATNATGAIWTEVAGLLKGAYDSTAATFTFSTTGTDSLYVYDFDGSTSTNDLRGIVLVGYVDAGAADTGTTGLVGTA